MPAPAGDRRLAHDGRLDLSLGLSGGRTVITGSFQVPPLNVMRPLYGNPLDRTEAAVVLMDSAGGMLPGNRNVISIEVAPGARARIRPQAATLIHPSFDGSVASQQVSVSVGEGASLIWEPEVTIPYRGSRYRIDVDVDLEETSVFAWGDILAPGRLMRGERFAFESLSSRMRIRRSGRLIAFDALSISPGGHGIDGLGALEGEDYLATAWIALPPRSGLDAHGLVEGDPHAGVTEVDEGLYLARLIGSDLVALRRLLGRIIALAPVPPSE